MKIAFDEITVRIRPLTEEIFVEERRRGMYSVKQILPAELLTLLKSGVKNGKCIDSGFLPENCLSMKIYDDKKDVALWRPAVPADVTYFDTLYERFPMPRLAFAFWLTPEGKTSNYRLAVMADEKPSPDTRLFEYPFSNVYNNSGICIGASNEMPVHKSPRTLSALTDFILSLPNNDHNFTAARNRPGLGYRDLMEHLKDKDAAYYYDRVLIPSRFTLSDFIENNIS
jgi:hypothetical protein